VTCAPGSNSGEGPRFRYRRRKLGIKRARDPEGYGPLSRAIRGDQIVIRSSSSRDLIARAVIELGDARAFVRGRGLRVLERSAGLEIGHDACACREPQRGVESSASRQRGSSRCRVACQCGQRRSGEGAFALVAYAGRLDCRHRGRLQECAARDACRLSHADVPTSACSWDVSLALEILALDTHADGRADARKGERHHRN
jgi:hypothetical protein